MFGEHRITKDKEYICDVTPEYFYQISQIIRFEQDETLFIKIKWILALKGWLPVPDGADITTYIRKASAKDLPAYVGDIYKRINQSNISTDFLHRLCDLHIKQFDLLTKVYEDIIQESQVVSVIDTLVRDSYTNMLDDADGKESVKLLKALWDVSPVVCGKCTGQGEVALSLLTGAVKGVIGDLEIPSAKIEVKGADGRIGTVRFTYDTFERLCEYFNLPPAHVVDMFYRYEFEANRRRQIEKLLSDHRTYRELLISKLSVKLAEVNNSISIRTATGKKLRIGDSTAQRNIRECMHYIKNLHDDLYSYDSVHTEKTGISTASLKKLANQYIQLRKIRQQQYESPKDIERLTYHNCGKLIFEHILKDTTSELHQRVLDNIPDIIWLFRNYDQVPEESSILREIKSLTSDKNSITLLEFKRILLSVHLYLYQREKMFTHLQLLNNKSYASYTVKISDTSTPIYSIYQQLIPEIDVSMHIGNISPCGVQVNLKV